MSLIRGDPFDDLGSLRESMDKLFDEFFTRRPERGRLAPVVWQPAIEADETEGDVVVRAELPGVDPNQVEITVTPDTLTIKGEARSEQEDRRRNYYRRELRHGAFVRSIALPAGVQGDQAKASYKDGILEKTVKVEVGG